MLRSPAITATAIVSITSSGSPYGSSRSPGASTAPVSPAVNAPKAQPTEETRSASTPDSSASRRLSTTARTCVPNGVQRPTTVTAAPSTATTASTAHGEDGSRDGASPSGVGPHNRNATPTSSTNTPSEATSVSTGPAPRRCSRRNTVASSTQPIAGAKTSRHAGTATARGQPQTTIVCRTA